MSRGPGRWQRAILEALATSEWRYLHDLVPCKRKVRYTWINAYSEKPKWGPSQYWGLTASDRLAALRAAHTLARQGKIKLYTSRDRSLPTVVARPGVTLTYGDYYITPRDFDRRPYLRVNDNGEVTRITPTF
jgi:hypothetical protein